jgi:hypothetical protein
VAWSKCEAAHRDRVDYQSRDQFVPPDGKWVISISAFLVISLTAFLVIFLTAYLVISRSAFLEKVLSAGASPLTARISLTLQARERWGFRPYLLVFQADAERSFCHPDSGRVNNLISNLANPALSAAAARGILSFQSSVFQVDKTVGPLVATCKFKVRFFGKTRRDVFLSVARRVAAPSVRDVSRASAAGYGNPGTAVASALFRNSKCDQFYSRCHF